MEPHKADFLRLNACCAANATGIRNDTLILQAKWVSVLVGTLFSLITFIAVFGNSLVILSVYIKRKLRTITNCFVVSLATSDLLVVILILPLRLKLEVTGVWGMGTVLCDMWLSCDVMMCTASILNLCCISLDRFFAITNPLIYATKRSKRLALRMIGLAWVASVVITCPLIFGSHEARRGQDVSCELTRNPGYVIYSSLGAFYIPLFVIVCVYARIFQAIRQRDKLLEPYCTTHVSGKSRGLLCWKREWLSSSTPCDAGRPPTALVTALTDPIRMNPKDQGSEHNTEEEEKGYLERYPSSTHSSIQCNYILMAKVQSGQTVSSTMKANDANHNRSSNGRNSVPESLGNVTSSGCVKASHVPERTRCHEENMEKNCVLAWEEKGCERATLQRECKTAKRLAIVVGCFVICWLPFFVVNIVEPTCKHCNINPAMKIIVIWLGYLNSALNPFIYAFCDKDLRESSWKLTCGLVCSTR